MKPTKAMTIRLSAEQAEQLSTVASIDGQPLAEVIRAAISEHIEKRRSDADFRDSLRSRIEKTQLLLDE